MSKSLRGIANSLCQMCVSHRIDTSLERLADLPDGTIEVDFLKRSCRHTDAGALQLPFVEELSAWLSAQLEQAGISFDSLEQARARLTLSYSNRVPTDRSRILLLDLKRSSQFEVQGRVIEGHSTNGLWYQRPVV